jgi:L-fuculose-phosphate aldolase
MKAIRVDGLSSSPLSAATATAGLVHVSGQVGRDRATGAVAEAFGAQMRLALDNLDVVLAAAGAGRSSVVKTTVLLPRREDFPSMNRIYAEHFPEPRPARTTLICDLAHPDLLFEIEAVAEPGASGSADGALPHATERAAVADFGRRLERQGLLSLTSGNISVRLRGERLAISPSSTPYSLIQPADVVVTTLDEEVVEGGRAPSSELPFHAALYRARPDVGAIVHTHSLNATTVATLRRPIPPVHYSIAVLELDEVPLVPYETFGSTRLAERVIDALGDRGKAALLGGHGAVALGGDLDEAAAAAEILETLAALYYRALCVGEPVVMTPGELEQVQAAMGRKRARTGQDA